jgi:hypothetical protein
MADFRFDGEWVYIDEGWNVTYRGHRRDFLHLCRKCMLTTRSPLWIGL